MSAPLNMTLRLASENEDGHETGDAIYVVLGYLNAEQAAEATKDDFLLDVLSASEALAHAWWEAHREAH